MDFTGSGGERRLSLLPRAPTPALVRSRVFSLAWRCVLSPALLCHPDGEDHAARLRAGLEPLRLWIGVGDDARAHLDGGAAAVADHRPDGDARVQGARVGDVPDGSSVGATAGGLELFDDLHGPDLGSA